MARGRKFYLIIFGIIISSAFLIGRVFVYDSDIAHPGLTKLAGELYNNQISNPKLSEQEISWLEQGAIDEDHPFRWMNHFYDPIYNQGFKSFYDTAKLWSQNPNNQNDYSLGDQSWQRAIYEYQQGNKKQAFLALGHILHLLEDMTVPAHTRDDSHIEGDPYEQWVKINFNNVSASPIYYDNLNKYFDYLANYSNNNFYSKDTIENKDYQKIEIIKEEYFSKEKRVMVYFYSLIDGKDYKLFWSPLETKWDEFYKISQKFIDDPLINFDHFSLLAPKAVGAGAGVIKLFFDEVNKERLKSPTHWQTSFWGFLQRPAGKLVQLGEEIFNSFKTNLAGRGSTLAQTESKNQPNSNQQATPLIVSFPEEDISLLREIPSVTGPTRALAPMAGQAQKYIPIVESTLPPFPEQEDLTSGFLATSTLPIMHVSPPAPVVSSSINLVYSGNGYSYSSSASTVTTISESAGIVPSIVSDQASVSSTPPLSQDSASSTPPEFSSPAQSSSTLPIVEESTSSTLPDTLASSTLSTSTTSTSEILEPPSLLPLPKVVINEIAWAGTQASSNDEWMELYNASDFAADLSGWTLTDGNDIKINFSSSSVTTIPTRGFYLLERTSETTISDLSADLIYKGALNNSGEKLVLKNNQGEIIDEADCSNKWLSGRADYEKPSMERINFSASGNEGNNWQDASPAVWGNYDANGQIIAGTPHRANTAIVYLNGILNQDRVLVPENNPYFLGYLTIASGTVLAINPGVVILGGYYSALEVRGRLDSLGKENYPVIFTSYADPDFQGYNIKDTNWAQIRSYPGAVVNLQNTQMKKGNSNRDAQKPASLIYAEGSAITLNGADLQSDQNMGDRYLAQFIDSEVAINNSSFHDSLLGLKLSGGKGIIKNSNFANIGLKALEAGNVAALILENNIFKDNGWDYLNRQSWDRPSPLISPIIFKDYLPNLKDNQWINNVINAPEWLGQIKSSGTINLADETPLVIGSLEIPLGVEVVVNAGSVLKMTKNALINIQGSLNILGTEEEPVILTSLNDDSDGLNLDLGEPRDPSPDGREWSQIAFNNSATSTLNWTKIKYANNISSPSAAIYVNGSPVIFDHLTLENSRVPESAMILKQASGASVKNSLIKNFTKWDINLLGNSPAGIFIDGGIPFLDNVIIDTFNYGLILRNGASPEIGPSDIHYQNVDVPIGH